MKLIGSSTAAAMARVTGPANIPWVGLCGVLAFIVSALALTSSARGEGARVTPDVIRPLLRFESVGERTGLYPEVLGIRGHAAGWGDADGDGWPDLYVGTFHTSGSKPNIFFWNRSGSFQVDQQAELQISTRASASLFADLDNDGDLDLYVSSMPSAKGSSLAEREGHSLAGCSLFRNEGGGRFTNISLENGACPADLGGRSAAVLDYDGDGLLDLLVGSDPLPGYNGSDSKSSRLFRNLGSLRFADVSREAGLPAEIPGLGVAAADVNNDTWPDFFLASHEGGNRLFLNDGRGRFGEAAEARQVFAWPEAGGDDMVCGVAFGDVNRDGLLDVVIGQHFERPWREPVANRLFLNRGIHDGVPRFEDVTEEAGLLPLPMKSPHVEIQDFNNDGIPDIGTSIVVFQGARVHPLIFVGLGTVEGLPRFQQAALALSDFPTAEDRSIRRAGDFFKKMLRDRKIFYTAPGPSADFDRDGRLDMFLPSWWVEAPSLLLQNRSDAGNWLQVVIAGSDGINQMGIGSRIRLFPPGQVESGRLIGCREIAAGYGYASGQEAIAHFGLGDLSACDIEVILPHNKGRVIRKNIPANQRITISP